MFIYILFLIFASFQNSAKMIRTTKKDPFWINPCGLHKEPPNKDCSINSILNKTIINVTLQYCISDIQRASEDAQKLQVYLVSLGYLN